MTAGVRRCKVSNCRNTKTGSIKLFSLPKAGQRRDLWLKRMAMMNYVNANVKKLFVCSLHFVSGKPSGEFNQKHVDWAPSINLGLKEPKLRLVGEQVNDVHLDRHENPPVLMVDVILAEATVESGSVSPTVLITDSSSADLAEQNRTSAYPLLETSPVLNICSEPVTDPELTSIDSSEISQVNQLTDLSYQLTILKEKLSVAEEQVLHANNCILELNSKLSTANDRIALLEKSLEQRQTVEETIKNET